MQAKPAPSVYYRNLPHFQREGKTLFVTLCTFNRWPIPETLRGIVVHHCLFDHNRRYHVHGLVVMPDHVHMIMTPLMDNVGNYFGLSEIMSGIKNTSAHRINKALNRTGPVWQREHFDHLLRSDENLHCKVEYVCQNPVQKHLVKSEEEYP